MVLFLCGTPASGKSNFGRFLRDKHDYFYIDMEHSPWSDENLHNVWDLIFCSSCNKAPVRNFVKSLENKSNKVVLDLGFPVHENYFRIIPLLKKFHCRVIWFQCDEDVARRRYAERNDRPIEWFETQLNNIRAG